MSEYVAAVTRYALTGDKTILVDIHPLAAVLRRNAEEDASSVTILWRLKADAEEIDVPALDRIARAADETAANARAEVAKLQATVAEAEEAAAAARSDIGAAHRRRKLYEEYRPKIARLAPESRAAAEKMFTKTKGNR